MATDDNAPPALTLELGADRVSAGDFRELARVFTGLLADISEEACGDAGTVPWEISLSRGSILIAAELAPATNPDISDRVWGVVLRPTPRIRQALLKFPRTALAMRLLAGEERQDLLQETRDEPSRHPSEITEYGTVEGTLDTLGARGGFHFTISEPIWNMAVRCTVPDDLVESMHGMWRQRVAAHGMVRYDRAGFPTSIQAEEVEPFPYDETPIDEFRGLLASD